MPNLLSIKFSARKKLPNPPFEINRATLTLLTVNGAGTLRAKFYGAGKTPVYSIDLESCEPSYAALVKNAKCVTFARGASSASVANPIAPSLKITS